MTGVDLKPDFTIIHHVMGSVEKSTECDTRKKVEGGLFTLLGIFVSAKLAGEGDDSLYSCIAALWEQG